MAFPEAAERRYEKALRQRMTRLHELTKRLLLPALQQAATDLGTRADDDEDAARSVKRLWRAVKGIRIEWEQSVDDRQLEQLAGKVGSEVSAVGKEGLRSQIKAVLGLDPLLGDKPAAAQLANFRQANVELIKSIDQRYLNEVNGIVQRGLQAGTRPETLAREIDKRYQVGLSRATLIARDQLGKLAGQLDRIRQTDLGIKRYIWRTSKDERVRDEHAEREGQTFSWDDPPEGEHPGEAVQCRCVASPAIEDLLTELEGSPE
jgi:SPP1 gp7 family putative phage head morphogenesis protein